MVDELADDGDGGWRVLTQTGTRYLLDLDRRRIRRLPAPGALSTWMRRDGEELHLIELCQCRVGSPLIILVDLQVPGARHTQRTSDQIRRIRPIANGFGTR
jgi:hypothetical protein